MTHQRIYLDNAATTWPKPEAVYDAVDRYQREIGAPNGRSGYREAQQSNRIVEQARLGVAQLIGVSNPSHIVFGYNCSDMLNMAIRGVVRPNDHVVTTVCDHNSVLRPLHMMREEMGVEVAYVPCDGQGFVSPDDVRAAIRPNTRLVAVNHASNVTGAIQPIDEMGRLVRETDALFLVDAAQSFGHVPIDLRTLEVDLLAAPGHKGLLGPLGTGVLYIRPGIEHEVKPLRYGGTGTQSDEDRQPDVLPQKYEPGNHNLVGLAGLAAATEFLRAKTVEAIHAHHTRLVLKLIEELSDMEGVKIYGPKLAAERTSVVSITVEGYEPQELSAILDSTYHIQTRAGFQCAPRMHDALGTTAGGGTLRFSPGYATTLDEINTAIDALRQIAEATVQSNSG